MECVFKTTKAEIDTEESVKWKRAFALLARKEKN